MEHYFHDLERHPPLSAAEEMQLARRVLGGRQHYWRALLSYAPLLVPVLREIDAAEIEQTKQVVDDARTAAAQLGGRPNQRQRDAAAPALEALALAMADADPGSELADRIAADVDALASGRACPFAVRRPSPESGTFRAYLGAIRSARAGLSTARNAMVNANLRLVVKMADRYRRREGLPLADLVQEGNLGLLRAVDRFDPRRGFRFSTYGTWWIRHAIGRAVADKGRAVRLPVHVGELQTRVLRARSQFAVKHHRAPSLAELAEILEVSAEKIERLDRAPTLRQIVQDDPETGVPRDAVSVLPDPEPLVDHRMDDGRLGEVVDDALEDLRPIELDILRRRFGLDDVQEMTLREVGELHGLSRERIRQMQNSALGKIRAVLSGHGFAAAVS